MAGLLGTHRYQLDPKGRVSLPKGFRGSFGAGAFLTLGLDGCVFAFPASEWQRRAEEVGSKPMADSESRAYARMFFGSAEAIELDSQGRLLLPQRLRSRAGIKREVVVVGVMDRMEIWDGAAWERYAGAHAGAYEAGTLEP